MITPRQQEVDAIRALALIGICVVNVPFMALPVAETFAAPEQRVDQWVACLVDVLFQLKFFLLFSFLFGYGIGQQQRAAEAAQRAFRALHFRRLAALALFGCLHAVLVFSGDILLLYAVLGCLLWRCQHLPASQLRQCTLAMLPLSLICLSVLAIVVSELSTTPAAGMTATRSPLAGDFWQATIGRWQDWPTTFAFLLLLQGPLAFAACVLGLLAQRSQFFQPGNPQFARLNRQIPKLLWLAVPTNALYGLTLSGLLPAASEWLQFIGFIGIGVGAPCLAAVYLCWIVRLARRFTLPALVLRAGRNSLSVYIAQGVLAGLLFGGYGLGLFAQLSQAGLLAVSLGIAALTILAVGSYAHYFQRGPLEPWFRRLAGS